MAEVGRELGYQMVSIQTLNMLGKICVKYICIHIMYIHIVLLIISIILLYFLFDHGEFFSFAAQQVEICF